MHNYISQRWDEKICLNCESPLDETEALLCLPGDETVMVDIDCDECNHTNTFHFTLSDADSDNLKG